MLFLSILFDAVNLFSLNETKFLLYRFLFQHMFFCFFKYLYMLTFTCIYKVFQTFVCLYLSLYLNMYFLHTWFVAWSKFISVLSACGVWLPKCWSDSGGRGHRDLRLTAVWFAPPSACFGLDLCQLSAVTVLFLWTSLHSSLFMRLYFNCTLSRCVHAFECVCVLVNMWLWGPGIHFRPIVWGHFDLFSLFLWFLVFGSFLFLSLTVKT